MAVFLILSSGQPVFAKEFTYNVIVSGLETKGEDRIKTVFASASLLENSRSKPIISVANLQKHVEADIKLMDRILRAEGYYDSSITKRMIRQKNHFEIEINVISGPLYTIGKTVIDYGSSFPSEGVAAVINSRLSLGNGDPARAEDVINTEAQLFDILPELGFPFAKNIKRDISVDHQSKKMNVNFFVDLGERRRFGDIYIKGLHAVEEQYIRKFILWNDQDYFDRRRVHNLQRRLNKMGLFSSVNIDVKPEGSTQAKVMITLTEAKHKTIGAAAGYSTSEGVSGEISWEHRNFLGRGNRLKLLARGAEIEQSVSSRLEIPNFSRLDQTLSFEAGYRRQDTDAYFANTVNVSAGINRVITRKLALRAGLELEYSDITDTKVDRHFYIASLPIGARWDSTDDFLDPRHGFRTSFVTAPSLGIDGKKFFFVKSELRASAYYPILSEITIVAVRTRLGSIVGAETETLPATRRFFAGGGGSVRGYSFQRIGPVDSDNNPLGGRSVNEISVELRWKVMPNISIVPFIEGGNIYDSEFPQFSNLQWGVGLGGRYHTGFGPVRLDIAFPVNRRPGDSRFQFYVSLGQAF